MPIANMRKFSDLVRAGMSSVPSRMALLEQHRTKVVEDMAMMQSALAVIDTKNERYQEISAARTRPAKTKLASRT